MSLKKRITEGTEGTEEENREIFTTHWGLLYAVEWDMGFEDTGKGDGGEVLD